MSHVAAYSGHNIFMRDALGTQHSAHMQHGDTATTVGGVMASVVAGKLGMYTIPGRLAFWFWCLDRAKQVAVGIDTQQVYVFVFLNLSIASGPQ